MSRRTALARDASPKRRIARHAAPPTDFAYHRDSFTIALRAGGKAEKTIAIYLTAVDALGAYLGLPKTPVQIEDIQRTHVELFLASLRDAQPRTGQPYSEATVSQFFRSLQAFFKYLSASDGPIPDASPMRNIKPPKITDNPPPVLTDEQIKKLLATCDGPSFVERRDTAIIRLFADTGVRLSELTNCTVADIEPIYFRLTVTGKFGRTRQPSFGKVTAHAINRYLLIRNRHRDAALPDMWLGQRGRMTTNGVYQMIERRAAEAGIEDCHPHALRHLFASNFLATGGQEGDLMQLAGWRSRSMIDRYGRSARADRAAKNYQGHSLMDRLAKN